MEQKSYNLEIINILTKQKDHARSIAKKLSTNHTNINRKLQNLMKENVLDFKLQGKNKIYFLKNTIEAKESIIIAEKYKLLKTLKKYPKLREIIEKIQKHNKIELAILFGSYAKNLAKENSDIDIFIKTENPKIKQELSRISSKLSIKIGNLDKANPLVNEIKNNHVIIKGAEQYHEGS